MKKIAILGSTGSIGCQTIQVIDKNPDFKVVSITANKNEKLLKQQADYLNPEYSACVCVDGEKSLLTAVQRDIDLAVIATGGISSCQAVIYCLENDVDVAIANKEVLVCCGELISKKLKKSKSKLIPIDSEHSAIFQCLYAQNRDVEKIILTASGGSFYDLSPAQLSQVNPKQASCHPRWHMGADITLDCNTLFNKNLEVLEASVLFQIKPEKIKILRHAQSIVHSLVEFVDGALLAQLSCTDMRIPISYALNYPNGKGNDMPKLNLAQIGNLSFEELDTVKFPCATLCYNGEFNSGLMPTVMVGGNYAARNLFRKGKIKFTDIYQAIVKCLSHYSLQKSEVSLKSVQEIYLDAINYTYSLYGE